MLKSISAGIGVALALPLGWLLFWWLGIVSLKFPHVEGKAIGLYGSVGGKVAELLVVGSVFGVITASLLYIFHFRKA
jgi:hypothetical protein